MTEACEEALKLWKGWLRIDNMSRCSLSADGPTVGSCQVTHQEGPPDMISKSRPISNVKQEGLAFYVHQKSKVFLEDTLHPIPFIASQ